ncbi:MAG: hypothetical protein JKY65_24620 [Planctomycetes bacterium]|nr:hypothetical protein [Planctomycetota bacterium]
MQPALSGLSEVQALSGSKIGDAKSVHLNGRKMRVLDCSSSKLPREVLDYYCEIADGQTTPDVPFVLSRAAHGGGMVLWVSPNGEARAVCVEPDPVGGTRYRIIIDPSGGALGTPPEDGSSPLPGGLRSNQLSGFTIESSVAADDGSGMLIMSTPGSPRGAANRVLVPLEARGFSCDRAALAAYDAASGLLIVPLVHPSGIRGTLSLRKAPQGERTRLSLTLYPGL